MTSFDEYSEGSDFQPPGPEMVPLTKGEYVLTAEQERLRHQAYVDGVPYLLDSTWEMLGGKPLDPAEQIRKGQEYMRLRYGHVLPPPEDNPA